MESQSYDECSYPIRNEVYSYKTGDYYKEIKKVKGKTLLPFTFYLFSQKETTIFLRGLLACGRAYLLLLHRKLCTSYLRWSEERRRGSILGYGGQSSPGWSYTGRWRGYAIQLPKRGRSVGLG